MKFILNISLLFQVSMNFLVWCEQTAHKVSSGRTSLLDLICTTHKKEYTDGFYSPVTTNCVYPTIQLIIFQCLQCYDWFFYQESWKFFCTYQHTAETEADAAGSSSDMKDLFGRILPKQKQQVYISTTTGTNSPWSHSTNIRQIMKEALEGTMWMWPPERNQWRKGTPPAFLNGSVNVKLESWWIFFSFLFFFWGGGSGVQRSKSLMWACQDP